MFDVLLLHPAVQHLFLQRDVDLLVAIAGALALVVERPHERIGEKHPGKALGIEIVGHHGPVGHALLDIQLVEQVGKIRVALRLLQFSFFLHQPLGVFRREVVVGIAEQRLGCGHQLGIRIARAQRGAARRRSHGIDIGIVGKARMRVMIEDGNLFDLRQKALIDLLHIRPGQRTSLA